MNACSHQPCDHDCHSMCWQCHYEDPSHKQSMSFSMKSHQINFALILFPVIQSGQDFAHITTAAFTILHMSRQLSCRDMITINLHVKATGFFSRFELWAHKSFVKHVLGQGNAFLHCQSGWLAICIFGWLTFAIYVTPVSHQWDTVGLLCHSSHPAQNAQVTTQVITDLPSWCITWSKLSLFEVFYIIYPSIYLFIYSFLKYLL